MKIPNVINQYLRLVIHQDLGFSGPKISSKSYLCFQPGTLQISKAPQLHHPFFAKNESVVNNLDRHQNYTQFLIRLPVQLISFGLALTVATRRKYKICMPSWNRMLVIFLKLTIEIQITVASFPTIQNIVHLSFYQDQDLFWRKGEVLYNQKQSIHHDFPIHFSIFCFDSTSYKIVNLRCSNHRPSSKAGASYLKMKS